MSNFSITDVPKDAAFNVRMFVKENKGELNTLVKSISLYLLILVIAALYINYHVQMDAIEFMKDNRPTEGLTGTLDFLAAVQNNSLSHPLVWVAQIINVLFAYCFAVIAVSWHRLVLLGRERYEPMKINAPQRHELNFVGVWVLIGTIVPFIMTYYGSMNFVVLFSMTLLPYLIFKISFYFPAKALDSHISFQDSFRLTNGYFWKSIFTSFRAFWRVILVLFVVVFFAAFIGAAIGQTLFGTSDVDPFLKGAYNQVVNQAFQTVIVVFFFQPLFTVLGVTILSNFYQHALRHKPASSDVMV